MVQFKFTYQSSDGSPTVSVEQMTAFEVAGEIWSKYLKDDVTVNVHVNMSDELPDNVIGGALPAVKAEHSYSDFRTKLSSDATSQSDAIAQDNFRDANSDGAIADNYYVYDHGLVNITTANAKALGIIAPHSTALDATVVMSDLSNLSVNQDASSNNNITWSYAGNGTADTSNATLDFLSVAIHELGHVLGFASGIDNGSWLEEFNHVDGLVEKGSLSVSTDSYDWNGKTYELKVIEALKDVVRSRSMPLDYFRFSRDSSWWNLRELSFGGDAYFSIDRGYNRIADFSTTAHSNGDGYQASHWENTTYASNIMNPTLGVNQQNSISPLDLQAFDVIGWDLSPSLLGSSTSINLADLQQTFDQQNTSTLRNLWNSKNDYVLSNQFNLQRDRLSDVLNMIEASDVYEGRGSRRTTRRQELLEVFAQEALFSNFEIDEWQSYVESVTVKKAGTAGADVMKGSIGGDRLRGMGDADILKGYEGDDLLRGNQEGDRIFGGTGNDTLIGGNGDDMLKGEAGNDWIKGGAGTDVMVGGEGADTFIIDNAAGFNVIRDFTVGEDQLIIAENLTVTIGQQNAHTIITSAMDENNLLAVLRNVDAQTLATQNES